MGLSISTHTSLLARLAEGGDHLAWREFEDHYGELIRGFARRRNLQPSDCDDVVQDVLLSLTQILPGFRYDPCKGRFRSYLKTVTLRAIFKRNRQKHGAVALEAIEAATRAASADREIEESWEAEWRQYHMRQAMRAVETEFNVADRRAFQRYAIEGTDARQTADALNMSIDQVYQAKSRILKRLTQLIEQQVQEEG